MEPLDDPLEEKKEGANLDATVLDEDDAFAQIGQAEVEASTTTAPEVTIPVDFETPSIHMEAGEEEDLFDKIGSGMEAPEPEAEEDMERPQAGKSEPIQLVEDAANDLFDTLGVEHYDPTVDHIESKETGQPSQDLEGPEATSTSSTETPQVTKDISTVSEDRQSVDEETVPIAEETPALVRDTADEITTTEEHTAGASDVFDTLDTSDSLDQPEALTQPSLPTAPAAADDDQIILEDGGDGDDLFATLASDGDSAQETATIDQPMEPSSLAQPVTSTLELVETEHDSLFDNIGAADEQPEGLAESGD